MSGKKNGIEFYMDRLSQITDELGKSEVSLDDAVKLYKEGMSAAAKAEELLSGYEKEIEIIGESEKKDEQ